MIALQEMTIDEAFEAEVLQMDPVSIVDANGERYTLAEAAAQGLVEPRTAKQILKAIDPYALQKYIDRHEIDPQKGDYVDLKNREVNVNSSRETLHSACEAEKQPGVFHLIPQTHKTTGLWLLSVLVDICLPRKSRLFVLLVVTHALIHFRPCVSKTPLIKANLTLRKFSTWSCLQETSFH